MAKVIEKWVTSSDLSERKVWIVPVINPAGVIKYPRVSQHIGNSLIKAVFDERSMDPRLVSVQLAPGLEDNGWELVADNLADADMAVAWPFFQSWMRKTPMMGATEPCAPFPEKYMPPGCAERKAGRAAHQVEAEEISIPELDGRPERPAHTSNRKRTRAGMD